MLSSQAEPRCAGPCHSCVGLGCPSIWLPSDCSIGLSLCRLALFCCRNLLLLCSCSVLLSRHWLIHQSSPPITGFPLKHGCHSEPEDQGDEQVLAILTHSPYNGGDAEGSLSLHLQLFPFSFSLQNQKALLWEWLVLECRGDWMEGRIPSSQLPFPVGKEIRNYNVRALLV